MRFTRLFFAFALFAGAVACSTSDDSAVASDAHLETAPAGDIPLFQQTSVIDVRLEAPLQELFDKIPTPVVDEYAPGGFDVPDVSGLSTKGKITYQDASGPKTVPCTITIRGNTSVFELKFPKLTIDVAKADARGTIFEHSKKIKIGTHGGESADLTVLGRRANQEAPHREAFAYQLLSTFGITTLKTRPANITYVDTSPGHKVLAADPNGVLVRKAFFLEDSDDTASRYGMKELKEIEDHNGLDEVSGKYDAVELMRLRLAEALIGNLDWEIGRSFYNMKVFATPDDKHVSFAPYDFDLADTVTANTQVAEHSLFFGDKSPAFQRIASLLNDLRANGYQKAEVTAALASLAQARPAAEALIASATLDATDKKLMSDYVGAFFEATKPEAFFLPHTITPTELFTDAALTKRAGESDPEDPYVGIYNCGSPFQIMEKSPDGKSVHIRLLYQDFGDVKDAWIRTEDVIGGDGTIPDDVPPCFTPGTD